MINISLEIKPCPCCGSTASQMENKKGTRICIQCQNVNCGLRSGWFLTYAEAAAVWNKRPQPVENSTPGYIWPWEDPSDRLLEELRRKSRIIDTIKAALGEK